MSGIIQNTAESIARAVSGDPDLVLDALLPTRILYLSDIAAAWFNGSKNDLIGLIPLTAAQAVVGTRVRIRGKVKTHFHGNSPNAGGTTLLTLVFNLAANAANRDEGVLIAINNAESNVFEFDIELELQAGASGKYNIALYSTHQIYVATALSAGVSFSRWGNESDGTLFIVPQTTEESIGSTAGIVVQLQVGGGTTSQSLCNFVLDCSYEISP